jgi:hypothetical protein
MFPLGEGGKRRVVEGVNSSMIYLIHCKNLYKYHTVFPPSTAIKKKKSFSFCHNSDVNWVSYKGFHWTIM